MTLAMSQPPAGRTAPAGDPVLNRFHRLCDLDPGEIEILRRRDDVLDVRGGASLTDSHLPSPRFLISGWAAWVKLSSPEAGQRRQIISFYLPGEPLAVCARPHPLSSGAIVALTPARTCDARQAAQRLTQSPDSGLARAFRVSACLAEAYLVNQTIRLGGLTAYQRLCHLFLEFLERMTGAGLGAQRSFPFALTQEMLGEALSLSTVHVNRTLQELRRDGLVEFAGGLAILPDPERAALACGYQAQHAALW